MILVNKKIGETPLDCIRKIKENKGRLARLPMTYAGRLDPMAEGLLIILVGDECKDEEKQKFLGMDKEYEFEVLFGFSTDTHDVLGLVEEIKNFDNPVNLEQKIHEVLKSFIRKRNQKYPRYSSKTIDGKALFSMARAGELDDEDIPEKEVEIKSLEFIEHKKMRAKEISEIIEDKIKNIEGDFRQAEILSKWKEVFRSPEILAEENLILVKFRALVTSGTYIRVIANEMGKALKIPSLAFSIKRTQIGDFKLRDIVS